MIAGVRDSRSVTRTEFLVPHGKVYRRFAVAKVLVLVVDDDAQYRRVVRIALTVRGYDVREAAGGSGALEETQGQGVDVILLDWIMPGMDGEATCNAIRAASNVPIIVVTASDHAQEALDAGAQAVLRKPVDIDTLTARLEAILGASGSSPVN